MSLQATLGVIVDVEIYMDIQVPALPTTDSAAKPFPPLWSIDRSLRRALPMSAPPRAQYFHLPASPCWGGGWGAGLAVLLPTHLAQFTQGPAIGGTPGLLLPQWRFGGESRRSTQRDSPWSKQASPGQLISVGVPMMATLGSESPMAQRTLASD